jgi:excinuclease UvrABC nuclease subunit
MPVGEWTWNDFTRPNVDQVPEIGGVYMLADPSSGQVAVFYVGQSGTLRSRLTQHLYEQENACIRRHLQLGTRHFCYKSVVGGEEARRTEEARLIAQYRPACNLQGGYV